MTKYNVNYVGIWISRYITLLIVFSVPWLQNSLPFRFYRTISSVISARGVVSLSSLHYQYFSWIFNCMRKADKNSDDKLSQKEIKDLLKLINVEVDDSYAEMLFKVKKRY